MVLTQKLTNNNRTELRVPKHTFIINEKSVYCFKISEKIGKWHQYNCLTTEKNRLRAIPFVIHKINSRWRKDHTVKGKIKVNRIE